MTDTRETEDDTLDLTEEQMLDTGDDDAPEQPDQQDEEDDLAFRTEVDEDEDDGLTDRPDDTPAIRSARAAARTQARRAAEAERELAQLRQPVQEPPAPGEYPDIEAFDFDTDRHREAVAKWRDASVARAKWESDQAAHREREQANEQRMMADYRGKAAALGVKDFDAAHSAVTAALPPATQALIGKYAKNSAEFVYALYRNPGVLARLAQQTDIAAQAIMIGELQRGMKSMTKRKAPPPPERDTIQRGTAPVSRASADKRAEKLLERAAASGNMDEYRRYLRDKKPA